MDTPQEAENNQNDISIKIFKIIEENFSELDDLAYDSEIKEKMQNVAKSINKNKKISSELIRNKANVINKVQSLIHENYENGKVEMQKEFKKSIEEFNQKPTVNSETKNQKNFINASDINFEINSLEEVDTLPLFKVNVGFLRDATNKDILSIKKIYGFIPNSNLQEKTLQDIYQNHLKQVFQTPDMGNKSKTYLFLLNLIKNHNPEGINPNQPFVESLPININLSLISKKYKQLKDSSLSIQQVFDTFNNQGKILNIQTEYAMKHWEPIFALFYKSGLLTFEKITK